MQAHNEHKDSPEVDPAPCNTGPPTSGPHTSYLAPWGVKREPIPDEAHNLEDGDAAVRFGDGLSYEETPMLAFATADGIVLAAWGRIPHLDNVDEDRIHDFIEACESIDHHSA